MSEVAGGVPEIYVRTWTIRSIHKWSGKEINNKMTFAAKMNFFRTLVPKTACEELQKYVAVLNHLGKKRKKKRSSVSASNILHMKENNSCYIQQIKGSKLNISAQETNF